MEETLFLKVVLLPIGEVWKESLVQAAINASFVPRVLNMIHVIRSRKNNGVTAHVMLMQYMEGYMALSKLRPLRVDHFRAAAECARRLSRLPSHGWKHVGSMGGPPFR